MKKDDKHLTIDLQLTDKQLLAWQYLKDFNSTAILFGGGASGGKTYLGCAWLILNCIQYPGSRWLMGRSKLSNLRNSTLNTFFDVCKKWKLTRNTFFTYNSQLNIIKFNNGSEIILKDLQFQPSDPNFDSLGSLEISGVFIDEATEVDYKCFNVLMSRIRYLLDEFGIAPKILLTCNPSTSSWIYSEFYLKDKNGELEGWKKFVQSLVSDNKYANSGYIHQLEKLDIQSKQRLLFGEWEIDNQYNLMENESIIQSFQHENRIRDIDDSLPYYLTIDVARMGNDTTTIILWKGLNAVKIEMMGKNRLSDLISKILMFTTDYNVPDYNVILDGVGVGGFAIDDLRDKIGSKVIEFIGNKSPINNENYKNLRTQMYYKLSDYINSSKIKIYCDDYLLRNKIVQELQSVIADRVDGETKLCILPKEKIKKIIGRSPDISDSLSMRMYFEYNTKKFTGVYSTYCKSVPTPGSSNGWY